MSISASTLRQLAALSLASDQMAGVLSIIAEMQEQEDARKEKQRARKARSRDNSVTATGQERDEVCDEGADHPPKERSPIPPKEITPLPSLRSGVLSAREAINLEFSQTFWPRYPHKVQRGAALKAWPRARSKADLESIMAGLERYIRDRPPDRHWQNPATFLNGESWNDQPADPPVSAKSGRPEPAHDTVLRSLARRFAEGVREDGRPLGEAPSPDTEGPRCDPDPYRGLEIPADLIRITG